MDILMLYFIDLPPTDDTGLFDIGVGTTEGSFIDSIGVSALAGSSGLSIIASAAF